MTTPLPTLSPPLPKKRNPSPKGPAKPRSAWKKSSGRRKKKPPTNLRLHFLLLSLEIFGLAVTGVAAVIVLLGYAANRLSGTSFFTSLLPFAGGILGLIVLTAILLSGWQNLRKRLQNRSLILPPAIALGLAVMIGCFAMQDRFTRAFGYYRTLVGGKQEAERVTLTHQVYAAYRRLNTGQIQIMIDRAAPYLPAIEEAAAVYAIDIDLLKGLAATESSFLSRDSKDGGQGLFQITRIPAEITLEVDNLFPSGERKLTNPRYNAFLGAATFKHYLAEMNDDLFLGLLAYNIGPANGGLRFIMDQYGATDFVTIQPYLLQLPRDYPIRVLSHALAFRIKAKEGHLLAYEEGRNAVRIQGFGIPGLQKNSPNKSGK
jgi:hypothetical protein